MGRLLDRKAEEEKKKKAAAPAPDAPLRFEVLPVAETSPAPYVAPAPTRRQSSTPETPREGEKGVVQTFAELAGIAAGTVGAIAEAPFRPSSWRAAGRGYEVGSFGLSSAVGRVGALAADTVGLDRLAARLNARAEEDRIIAEGLSSLYGFSGDARSVREKLQDPDYVAAGIGQNLPNLLAALLGGGAASVAGAGAALATGAGLATSGTLEYGGAYNDAVAAGVEDEATRRKVAGIVGVANAALDFLPIGRLLGRAPGGDVARKGIVREIASGLGKQAALEGGTESIQEINANAAARWYYDPDRPLLEGVTEAAFFGALMGGGVSVAADVARLSDFNVARFTGPDAQRGFIRNPLAPEDADNVRRLAEERKAKLEATPAEDMTPRHQQELQFLKENASNPEAVADAYGIVPPGEEAGNSLVPKTMAEAARTAAPSSAAEGAPVDSFATKLRAEGFSNPLVPGEIVIGDTDAGLGVALVLKKIDDATVELQNIRALEQGKGAGTQALARLRALADETGVTVIGSVGGSRLRGGGGMPDASLPDWYERNGFTVDRSGERAKISYTPARADTQAPASAADLARTMRAPEVSLEGVPTAPTTKAQRAIGRSLKAKPTLDTRGDLPRPAMVTETASEKTRLNNRLRAEQAVAKLAAKATKESIREAKTAVRDYAQEMLPVDERGRFMTVLKNAETPKDVAVALVRIEAAAAAVRKAATVRRIGKLARRALSSPSVSVEAKDAIRALVGNLDLKKRRADVLERYRETKAAVDEALASGRATPLDRKTLRALRVLELRPAFELTEEELGGIMAELEIAERLGREVIRDERAAYAAEKRLLKEALLQPGAVTPFGLEFRPEALPGEVTSRGAKFVEAVRRGFERAQKMHAALMPHDVIFDRLGGARGDYRSVPAMVFKAPVDAAHGRYVDRFAETFLPLQTLQAELDLSDARMQKIGAWAALRQEGGREKLANVYGARKFGKVGVELSPEERAAVEADIDAVSLDADETRMYDAMMAVNRALAPEIARTLREVYNQEFRAVDNYMSFLTDYDAMAEAGVEPHEAFDPSKMGEFEPRRRNVDRGMAELRKGAGRQIIKLNAYDVMLKHVNQAAYLIEVGRTAKLVAELASDPDVARALGPVGGRLVRDWTDLIARQGGKAGVERMAFLDGLRKNLGAAQLGLRLSSVMVQLSSIPAAATLVDAKYVALGVARMAAAAARSGRSAWRFVFDNMPQLREDTGDDPALVAETGRSLVARARNFGYLPMKSLDRFVRYAVAYGAYRQNLAERGVRYDAAKPDGEALAWAQLMVRRTQSTGSFVSAPLATTRGGFTGSKSADRLIFQFQSFWMTQWSRIVHDMFRSGIVGGTKALAAGDYAAAAASYGRASRIAFWTTVELMLVNELRALSQEIVDLVTGAADDEDEDEAGRLEQLAWAIAGTLPGASQVIGIARYGSSGVPLLDSLADVPTGVARAFGASSDESFWKGVTDAVGGAAATLGVPGTGQAAKAVKDVVETVHGPGSDDAELDLLFGGESSGRRKPGQASSSSGGERRKPGQSTSKDAAKKRKPGDSE